MWIYNLLIYIENEFILDYFFIWKITKHIFLHLYMLYYFLLIL